MLSVAFLIVMTNVNMLNDVILNVVMLSSVFYCYAACQKLSVGMLSVTFLIVILNVVMLNVVAP